MVAAADASTGLMRLALKTAGGESESADRSPKGISSSLINGMASHHIGVFARPKYGFD